MKKEQIASLLKDGKPCREFLKHEFTQDEILEKGKELARLSSEHISIDNERKAVASSFKAQLDGKSAEIEMIGNHINNGYEHRYVECVFVMNDPNTGFKCIYRKDTGETVRSMPMSQEEMQIGMDI